MGKIFLSLLGLTVGLFASNSVFAESKVKEFYTMDSMGCMILRECTENVQRIRSISDIQDNYPSSDYSYIAEEFDSMLLSLDKIGVMVFLAPEKYFPPGHRGVYHTVTNNFYLNDAFMKRPEVLMTVMRHEGWHAAQDCMAGTIKNSMIAIIMPEEDVPRFWREIVEQDYPESAWPWEAEAKWAGKTEGMTAKALDACANGPMWEVYKPTPLTLEWLKKNRFVK
jgi:hypothetical protein